jgi:hypothetical protein
VGAYGIVFVERDFPCISKNDIEGNYAVKYKTPAKKKLRRQSV